MKCHRFSKESVKTRKEIRENPHFPEPAYSFSALLLFEGTNCKMLREPITMDNILPDIHLPSKVHLKGLQCLYILKMLLEFKSYSLLATNL